MSNIALPLRPVTKKQLLVNLSQEEYNIGQAILQPDLFAETFLQTRLWSVQREIMQAVVTHERVAVKACHASSKTFTAARMVLWFLARYTDAIVVTTAPTWNQVEKLLWGEVHAALAKSRYKFPKALLTGLSFAPEFPKRYAYGLSTSVTNQDEGVRFQGIHAENILVIMDEAPGVDPKIWTAIEGARAGGNTRILAIGNPTISSGPFHDAFTNKRSGWKCFTISAFGSPNLEGITLDMLIGNEEKGIAPLSEEELKVEKFQGLVTRKWVKEKYYEWGPNHPLWEARVLGEFPHQSEDSLLSLAWLEAASRNTTKGKGKCTAGVDVAGPGEDETVVTIRRGCEILVHKAFSMKDSRGEVVNLLNGYKDELQAVNVDAIGIGLHFHTHLLDQGFPSVPIIAQSPSSDSEKYFNEKAEFYWGFRMRCEQGDLSGLTDETTIGQLAGIRFKHNSRGQIEIESKDNARKRGVKSPDRAESIVLAFADRQKLYGALQYYQEEAREMNAQSQKVLQSMLMKPGMSDNQLTCPNCKSTAVQRTQGDWRCQQCGNQWREPGEKQRPLPKPGRNNLMMK